MNNVLPFIIFIYNMNTYAFVWGLFFFSNHILFPKNLAISNFEKDDDKAILSSVKDITCIIVYLSSHELKQLKHQAAGKLEQEKKVGKRKPVSFFLPVSEKIKKKSFFDFVVLCLLQSKPTNSNNKDL